MSGRVGVLTRRVHGVLQGGEAAAAEKAAEVAAAALLLEALRAERDAALAGQVPTRPNHICRPSHAFLSPQSMHRPQLYANCKVVENPTVISGRVMHSSIPNNVLYSKWCRL